ncbi:MAG: NAD(P)-dependent oxidoreductase [Nitrosarchaeum sp.]|nr:NAD(P)-dependent oxidoreductase [Nitrosarchaeum sp.]
MKILLTGAAGGIGSTLGYYLFKKGHDLTLVDNLRNGYEENLLIDGKPFGNFFNQDICDSQLSDKLFNSYDCIIHLAAITALPDCESNVNETININVAGTTNIMECARKWNVSHVIFASTSAIYENNDEAVFTEKLKVNPRLWYSLSKKMAEDVCESYRINYGISITTLRFFNVFGPRQDIHRKNPPLLNYLVREIGKGNRPILHSNGKQSRDYIHVDDVVNLIDICLEKRPDDIFNVCTATLLSVNQIFKYVSEVFDNSTEPIYHQASKLWDNYPDLFSGHYPLDKEIVAKETNKYSKGSYQKANELLDWKPNINLEILIKKVVLEMKL